MAKYFNAVGRKESFEEVLMEMPKDYKIKIGSVGGNGFFYMGTNTDMLRQMKTYDRKAKDHIRKTHTGALNTYLVVRDNLPNFEKFKAYQKRKNLSAVSNLDYTKYRNAWMKKLDRTYKRKLETEEHLKNYVELPKRQIIDQFEAINGIDEDTMVIILDGYEIGKYWSFDEAKSLPAIMFSNNIALEDLENAG